MLIRLQFLTRLRRLSGVVLTLTCVGVVLTATSRVDAMTAEDLRVEYAERPLGVDVARPRFSWILLAEPRAQRQSAYQLLVASSPEHLAQERGDVWDSGKVTASENFGIEYLGTPLRSSTRYFWQVRVWDADGRPSAWSEASWWQTGLMAPEDWKAKWIGGADSGSPRLRREFRLDKKITRATAYAYAAGWYRLCVNGVEIADRVLVPVNSNYPKGLFYDTYDITHLVQEGANAVGLWLGNGYSQSYSKYGYRWATPLAALAQLEFVFADGTTQQVVTNETWKWGDSPIVANDIYHGEIYDARRENTGWSKAGFDDRSWEAVKLRDVKAGPLKSCPFPGLVVASDLRPVKLTEPKPGVFVFDLGQNIAGWVRLRVRGRSGSQVVLRHAEELHPDGMLDVTTNRSALATDLYILNGRGEETYEPRFTYHGFRYVEATGFPEPPTLESITGRAVQARLEDAGGFQCSEPPINQMHQNFRWTIANNLMGIPTDTASRDERTPCQMDSLTVEEAAMCNWRMASYYAKWLHDIAGDGGTLPNWTGDQVVLPLLLYQEYGDRRILEQHYENMKQVVERFAAVAEEHRYWAEGFGDWAPPGQPGRYETSFSEGELVNRAFFFRTARIVGDVASRLGRTDDADRFSRLAEAVRRQFATRFYRPESATYGSGRQVTAVLPLAFGMVDEANRAGVVEALRHRIETLDNTHLDTGIFGTRYLFEVLIDHGLTDLALKTLTAPGYPGYVDQISQGATTTWEQWSFRGSMQTHNHAMFSGPDATLFSRLGGIQAGAPGFREIVIRPALPEALSYVDCWRQTVMGRVACRWEKTAGGVIVRVTVPANASARIYLPAVALDRVSEGGRPAVKAEGVASAHMSGGSAVFSVGSGDYEFLVRR